MKALVGAPFPSLFQPLKVKANLSVSNGKGEKKKKDSSLLQANVPQDPRKIKFETLQRPTVRLKSFSSERLRDLAEQHDGTAFVC